MENIKNLIGESCTVAAGGEITLTGALPGALPFSEYALNATDIPVKVEQLDGTNTVILWEYRLSTKLANGLTRNSVVKSSNSNNPVTFTGPCKCFVFSPAELTTDAVRKSLPNRLLTNDSNIQLHALFSDPITPTTGLPFGTANRSWMVQTPAPEICSDFGTRVVKIQNPQGVVNHAVTTIGNLDPGPGRFSDWQLICEHSFSLTANSWQWERYEKFFASTLTERRLGYGVNVQRDSSGITGTSAQMAADEFNCQLPSYDANFPGEKFADFRHGEMVLIKFTPDGAQRQTSVVKIRTVYDPAFDDIQVNFEVEATLGAAPQTKNAQILFNTFGRVILPGLTIEDRPTQSPILRVVESQKPFRINTNLAPTDSTLSQAQVFFSDTSGVVRLHRTPFGGNVGQGIVGIGYKTPAAIGDGVTTQHVITHGLDTLDILVSARDVVTGAGPVVTVVGRTNTTCTIEFPAIATTGQYVCTVFGV